MGNDGIDLLGHTLVPASAASLSAPRWRNDGGRRRIKPCVFRGEPMRTRTPSAPSAVRSTTRSGRYDPEPGPAATAGTAAVGTGWQNAVRVAPSPRALPRPAT